MNELFREYRESDYSQCEELVNQAWGLDPLFSPGGLGDLAKFIYAKGAALSSNHRTVVELDGKVVGFLFGLNERGKRPGSNLLFGLSVLWRFMWIRSGKPEEKSELEARIAELEQRAHELDSKLADPDAMDDEESPPD